MCEFPACVRVCIIGEHSKHCDLNYKLTIIVLLLLLFFDTCLIIISQEDHMGILDSPFILNNFTTACNFKTHFMKSTMSHIGPPYK